MPADVRLHFVSAIVHLSHISEATLPERLFHAQEGLHVQGKGDRDRYGWD
ncbi:MAG: hypothetical protein ACYDDF_14565 [Thermoplasmatota archaeon]